MRYLFLASLLLAGCGVLTEHDRYVAVIAPYPLDFVVPVDSSDVYWNRAFDYLTEWSAFSIATDSLLQTDNRRKDGLTVRRSTVGDSVRFRLQNVRKDSDHTARKLSYYMHTERTYEDYTEEHQ